MAEIQTAAQLIASRGTDINAMQARQTYEQNISQIREQIAQQQQQQQTQQQEIANINNLVSLAARIKVGIPVMGYSNEQVAAAQKIIRGDYSWIPPELQSQAKAQFEAGTTGQRIDLSRNITTPQLYEFTDTGGTRYVGTKSFVESKMPTSTITLPSGQVVETKYAPSSQLYSTKMGFLTPYKEQVTEVSSAQQQQRINNYLKLVEEAKQLGYTFEPPQKVKDYFQSQVEVVKTPAVKQTVLNLGIFKIQKEISPAVNKEILKPGSVDMYGFTWTTTGYTRNLPSEFKPSLLQPVTSLSYYTGKYGGLFVNKELPAFSNLYKTLSNEKANTFYEFRHPVQSAIIRGAERYIDSAAPFIYFAPMLNTLPRVTPVQPKAPEIISQKNYVYKGEFSSETVVKIPRTYVNVESAFEIGNQRVQVSPTILQKTTFFSPVTLGEDNSLNLRGPVREQRILPENTRFTNFRGYDTGVSGKMMLEKITPLKELTPGITRAKVTSIELPIQSQIRIYKDKIWMREAGTLGGKTLTIKPDETTLFIPAPKVSAVVSKQKPFLSFAPIETTKEVPVSFAENILGFKEITIQEPSTGIATVRSMFEINPAGNIIHTRYSQGAIQIRPTFTPGEVSKSTLDIFMRVKPQVNYIPKRFLIDVESPITTPAASELLKFAQGPEISSSVTPIISSISQPSGLFLSGFVSNAKSPTALDKNITYYRDIQSPLPIEIPAPILTTPPKSAATPIPITQTGQKQIQEIQPILRTEQIQPQIPEFQAPSPVVTFIPLIPQSTTSRKELFRKLRARGTLMAKGYRTYFLRKGQRVYLPGVSPRAEAIKKGERKAVSSIAATFGIEPTNVPIAGIEQFYEPSSLIFRSFKISGRKQIPLKDEWIQKAGTAREPTIRGARLASRSEVAELSSFRMKKPKLFKKGGFFR